MMRAARGLAVGWTMLAALTAGARAQISLSSAVDLALRNDPTVKMAQSDVDRAKASRMEARDAYFPTLGVGGGVGEGLGVPLDVPQVFTVASHSLLFNFSQRDYMRAADAGLRAASLALLEAHDGVAEDVVLTYVRLNNAEQREVAMGQEFGDSTRLVAIVQDRLNAGQDDRIDLLKARQTSAQVHLAQLQTQDDIADLTDHLTRLMGLPGTRLATVTSSIPAMPSLDTPMRLEPDSYGIQSAFANAASKQEQAFGDARWRLRPQFSFGFNYSRISTAFTNYNDYYPMFNKAGNSDNAVSVGLQILIPVLDRQRSARASESADDAHHALLDAENRRNQFLEGRFKLRHSLEELQAQADLAGIDRDLAQEQLKTVMIQLSASSASAEAHQLSPEDEEHARIAVSARTVDLLNDQLALIEARVSLMRQTSTLDAWLQAAVDSSPSTPAGVVAAPVPH